MPLSLQPIFRRYWPVVLILVAGIGVSGLVGWSLYRHAIESDEARFELEATYIAALLEQTMERYEERLARLADYCAQFDEMPTRIWDFRSQTMTDLGGNLPNVMHAVYCPKVAATNFQAHLERGRRTWGVNYQFDPEARPGRDYALPVWQVYSRAGFVPIEPGADMAEESGWHPSLLPSLATARGSVSPRSVQVQRTNGSMETGFWFALTLFAVDQKTTAWRLKDETEEQMRRRHGAFKRSAATGSLAVFVSTDRMVDWAYNNPNPPRRLHARLYANREPSPTALLNPLSKPPKNPQHRRVIAQRWYGRSWCLELTSTPLFERESPRDRAWWLLGGGTAVTLLAAALVGVSLRARAHQERMTDEVVEARNALAVAEKERERLGHDLHDGAIQSLYAIQLGLTRTAQNVEASVPAAARVLNQTRERVDEVIAELRRFILSRESEESAGVLVGLGDVLAAMVVRLQPTTPAELSFHADAGAAARLSTAQAVQFTQIARTALSNCLRHARPQRVSIALRSSEGSVSLEIMDDGAGFDPERPNGSGIGLQTMRHRASEAGGTLVISSRPGEGTRIVVTIPAGDVEELKR